jgi:guanyl-specific ribonuclease Sa
MSNLLALGFPTISKTGTSAEDVVEYSLYDFLQGSLAQSQVNQAEKNRQSEMRKVVVPEPEEFDFSKVRVGPVAKTESTARFITTAEGVTIDLQPTLNRIASGGKFPHKNDGSVFKNFPPKGLTKPLLPLKPQGYYREFVHPTSGVNGAGAMRIVIGQGGEMWFTPDHYKSFIPIR